MSYIVQESSISVPEARMGALWDTVEIFCPDRIFDDGWIVEYDDLGNMVGFASGDDVSIGAVTEQIFSAMAPFLSENGYVRLQDEEGFLAEIHIYPKPESGQSLVSTVYLTRVDLNMDDRSSVLESIRSLVQRAIKIGVAPDDVQRVLSEEEVSAVLTA